MRLEEKKRRLNELKDRICPECGSGMDYIFVDGTSRYAKTEYMNRHKRNHHCHIFMCQNRHFIRDDADILEAEIREDERRMRTEGRHDGRRNRFRF